MEVKSLKNSYKVLLISSLFFLSLINFADPISAASKNVNASENKKIILIDAGHGGIDGGGVAKDGTLEKDINLKICVKLKSELEKNGYVALMTRDADEGLYTDNGKIRKKKIEDLNQRCKLKEETNCNMFISIHLNMFPQEKYYGAQVWYSNNEQSKNFAQLLQSNFKLNVDQSNNRVEKCAKNSYKILRCNDTIPSVIIECGFLSNNIEREKLKTDLYQQRIANSISNSIVNYYKSN